KMNYLASPPLVVAYAIAGRMDEDVAELIQDIWPTQAEIAEAMSAVEAEMFERSYGEVFEGDDEWNALEVPSGDRYEWDADSTYVKRPPYFELPPAAGPISGARALAVLGDSVTTDHISPAGAIKED